MKAATFSRWLAFFAMQMLMQKTEISTVAYHFQIKEIS
jgi:hypothetical protein